MILLIPVATPKVHGPLIEKGGPLFSFPQRRTYLDQSTDLGAGLGPMKNGGFWLWGMRCWSSSMTNLCVTCFLPWSLTENWSRARRWSWLIRWLYYPINWGILYHNVWAGAQSTRFFTRRNITNIIVGYWETEWGTFPSSVKEHLNKVSPMKWCPPFCTL